MNAGGIVLCGGRSRRMGRPKLSLPFGDETMLARVARRLGEAVAPIVVVAAAGQEVPPLPESVRVARDRRDDRGPLEGLAVGLGVLRDQADAAFVTTCDVPLLVPALVRKMIDLAARREADVLMPHVDGFDQPLSAVYRTSVLPHVERLLADGQLRPAYLFDAVPTRRVAADELTGVDPELDSLLNVNRPEDYETALRRAGIEE